MSARVVRVAAALVAAVLFAAACTGEDAPDPTVSVPVPTGNLPSTVEWKRIAEAPTARQEVAAAVVGGRIYVVGGLIEGGATAAVEIYDPSKGEWSEGPPLPIELHHAMAAELGGRLYVIGGFTGSLGAVASDRVFTLDDEGRWREAPPLRRPRAAAAAVIVGGRIVVVGGISGNRHVGPVEIFDGTGWRDGASIPSPRDHLGAATDGSVVYAAGGRRSGNHFATFEVYDPRADQWSALPRMPTARSGIGAAFVAGRVITVGGEGPRIFPEVESYSPAARRWERYPDLAVPVHGVGVVSVGSDVYALVGGIRVGGAPTNACQVLRLGF